MECSRARARSLIALSACLAPALLGLPACEKSGKDDVVNVQSPVKINKDALDQKVEDTKAKLEEQRKTFGEQSRQKLAELDQKIEALKTRAASGTAQAKQRANDALAQLERERAEARAALERAQSASEEKWEALKGGAGQALERAERAYNSALEKLKAD
jgi:hypothetical protein